MDDRGGTGDETVSNQELSEADVVQRVVDITAFDTEDAVRKSIARVQQNGVSHERTLLIHDRYAEGVATGTGLYSISGIGPTRGSILEQAGVATVPDLAEKRVKEISSILDVTESSATRLRNSAQESLERGDARGESFLSSDAPSAKQTEEANSEQVGVTSTKGTTADSESTGKADTEVSPNPLSEYYESIRGMRKVLSAFLQSGDTSPQPDDFTEPMVQYYTILDACITFGLDGINFGGYGHQHSRRLSFTIDDYREQFGNGTWITEYQVIDVEPFHPDTRQWLEQRSFVKQAENLARPVPPAHDHALPELVESKEELEIALSGLSYLPAYPHVPSDPAGTDRSLPVADIYNAIFSGEVDEEYLVAPGTISGPESLTIEDMHGPVTDSTPTSDKEVEEFLMDYGKLTHIFGRAKPPGRGPVHQSVPVFSLDWYKRDSPAFHELRMLAKEGKSEPVEYFLPRLRDLVNRRFLHDQWKYDYITVFPGHKAESLSPALVKLASESVADTNILYTPLLKRIETVSRQRGKSQEKRRKVAEDPEETLRCQNVLDGETVLLLDDIATSGSSLLAGVYNLRQAGAGRVIGLTLGLTPGESIHTQEITSPDRLASEIIAGI